MDSHLAEQLKDFETACRSVDLRLTPQRLEVFKELAKAKDHPNAEALHQRLVKRMPTLSLDTVYRTLGTFADLGVVNKVDTAESQARYEVPHLRHHHMICRKCKSIIDFEWPLIDEASLPENVQEWGRVDRKNIVVYGICQDCLKNR